GSGAGSNGSNTSKCDDGSNDTNSTDDGQERIAVLNNDNEFEAGPRKPAKPTKSKPCSVQAQGLQITTRSSVENDTTVIDPVFSVPDPADPPKRINTRRTTGRNTPSAVDAVFNYRNFWDGRAQNECNGANPFGSRDGQSHIMVTDDNGTIGPALINMKNS